MSIINAMSKDELNMFDVYRTNYMGGNGYNTVPVEKVLEAGWAPQKERYLYKLLGEQLIYTKEIVYELGEDKILERIYNLFDNPTSATAQFVREFNAWRDENEEKLKETGAEWLIHFLFAPAVLAQNLYNGITFYVNCPNDKVVKVQNGCRPMRTLLRILNMWGGLPHQDKFREEVSVVLTQRSLRGNLCLSIHPLDYATMSDNNHDWTSCMSWQDDGCYRCGTVEMMNSEAVIVAYLSDGNFNITNSQEWNSKMWRQLFIVSPKGIFGVKGYPYQNSQLVNIVLTTLAELAAKNLGWVYDDKVIAFQHADWFKYAHKDGEEEHDYCFKFRTADMYNDFGTITHYGIIASNWDGNVAEDGSAKAFCFNYSGPRQCMSCGRFVNEADFDDTVDLVCAECNDTYYCDDCGDRILSGEERYEVDGLILCQNCFDNSAGYDELDEEYHLLTKMTTLYVLPRDLTDEEKECLRTRWHSWSNRRCAYSIQTFEDNVNANWSDFFEAEPVEFCDDYTYNYYITEEVAMKSCLANSLEYWKTQFGNGPMPDPIIW